MRTLRRAVEDRRHLRRSRMASGAVIIGLGLMATATATASASPAGSTSRAGGELGPSALGVNTAAWDGLDRYHP